MKELITIQSKLKAPKSQFNAFGKYNYRNSEDILEAVKPLLLETNTYLTLFDDIVHIGERYYVKATARLHSSDSIVIAETTAFAREEESKKGMDGAQVTGSSSSYARKYALNGLFCIDDTKDADSTNDHGKGEQPKTENKKELPKQVGETKKPPLNQMLQDKVPCPEGKGENNMVSPKYCNKGCEFKAKCPTWYSSENEIPLDEIPI
jgi:hypothetical protein